MLKFKLSIQRLSADSKALEITDVTTYDESPRYEIVDEANGVVNTINDEKVLEFSAQDIYGIQSGSHIYGSNKIVLSNENASSINTYEYFEDLTVEQASKADNTFSVRIKKDLKLDVSNIYIERRNNAIRFNGVSWEVFNVSQFWLNENNVPKDNLIKTNEAAYGKNLRKTPYGDDTYDDYQVFYYENSSWKTINLIGKDDMEKCKSGKNIKFDTFKKYDKYGSTGRLGRELNENEIYYTQEDYIYFICYPTHYFTTPKETFSVEEDAESEMKYGYFTDYGKEIVESVDYPKVFFKYKTTEEGRIVQKSIEIECRREDDTQLCFNYDELTTDIRDILSNRLFSNGIDVELDRLEGDNGAFEICRENIMYNNDYTSFDIIYDTAVNTVQIPIAQHFETDMYHNDALNTHFVDVERANAINPIMDLEKDVYVPVIFKGNRGEGGEYVHINGDYKDCYNIIFNLHFREHRDTNSNEKWKCVNESYWNGTRTISKCDKCGKWFVGDSCPYCSSKEKKNVVDLRGRVYKYKKNDETKKEKYDYFSYFGVAPTNEAEERKDDGFDNPNFDENNDYKIDDVGYKSKRDDRNKLKEYQSDLLSYLGFTNDDVKYQKSKLKKSFLRISFYDSDNIANQNLLHTATIFLDSGELFAKYIKNIDTEDTYKVNSGFTDNKGGVEYVANEIIESKIYRKLDADLQKKCVINGELMAIVGSSTIPITDSATVYDKSGVRVNREPMREKALQKSDFSDNISELERLRLSSQIEVCDKNSSKRSSEGFYFYTYKNNDNGVFPSDIYMRVEFNHAGYGRTVPFMMPYIRKAEEDETNGVDRYKGRENKIKTFDDICYDWSDIDFDKPFDARKNEYPLKDEDEVGYGTVRYIKYAYIKWKYRYDKHTQKHVYYLDPDVYGSGVTTDNVHGNNIILNLYEGKVR